MTVRLALAGDLDEVLRVERSSETAPHWPAAEYERIIAGEGAVRRCLLVAEGGFAVGKVLGGEAEIESVAVAHEARRKGIGRELCRAIMRWCEAAGAERIELEVRAASLGARKLYEGLGFSEIGRRTAYYADPKEDAILMAYKYRSMANAESVEEKQQRSAE